jgi:hypothetical protein
MNLNADSYDFLCRILSPFTGPVGVCRLRRQITSGSVAWASVIGIANSHLVTPALWVRLSEKNLDRIIVPDVRDYLREIYALNLKRNQGLKRQALEVIGTLNKKDIHPLLIKGASQLFQPIHGDLGSRIMTDLDMWIPAGQIPAAVDVLTEIGYSDGGKSLKAYHHLAPLFRKGAFGAIELHREVLPEPIATVLNASLICKKAKNRTVEGVSYRTPTLSHAFLLCMLHSQVKDRFHNEWVIGLRSLNDMTAMVAHRSAGMDWSEIESRMVRHGLGPVLRAFLWHAHRLFKLPWPTGVRPALSAIVHHELCMSAIRWQLMDRLTVKVDYYSRYIHRRFGGFQRFFRHAVGQLIPG